MSAPQSTSRPVGWALGILIGLLALNWVATVARFQVEGLFWDQWVYCQPLFAPESNWLDLFMRQLGPHRQGLAFVLTAPVMDLASWDTRVEALWISFWLLVATLLALAWKRQLTGRLGWEDLWLPLALLSVRQFETIIVVPNLSHSVFPLVLLMGMAWVAAGAMSPWRWLVFGVLGGFALFTGFAIFAWVAAGWIVAMRLLRAWWTQDFRGAGWPLATGAILGLALLGFLQGYRFRGGSAGTEFPHFPLSDYPEFVVRMLASRMDLAGGNAWGVFAGWVVLLLAVVLLTHVSWRIFRDKQVSPGWVVAALLIFAGLSFGFFTAIGRIHLGVRAADAPRYVTLVGAVWLGFAAWGAASRWRWGGWLAAALGWSSVLMSWGDMFGRPLASWPGMLGMSEVSHNSIAFSNGRKMNWLLTWEETDDWRAAEARQPQGLFGEPESLKLGERIDWLAERGLSFADPERDELGWMPWWKPLGHTWVVGLIGERRQWMADEAVLIIEGRESGFMNLRFARRAPALPPEGKIRIALGDFAAEVESEKLIAGISLPAPRERTKLTLTSTIGTVPLNPPGDPRLASYLVENPTLSEAPQYEINWWTEDGAGLWQDDYAEAIEGRWNWEGEAGRRFVWTDATLALRSRARLQTYWNIEIEKRFDPVDHGPVILRWDDREVELPWEDGKLRFSVPMRGGVDHRLEVVNAAGARSPKDEGESGDARNLALQLTRLELKSEPVFDLVISEHED
jgi:hypothetical protein